MFAVIHAMLSCVVLECLLFKACLGELSSCIFTLKSWHGECLVGRLVPCPDNEVRHIDCASPDCKLNRHGCGCHLFNSVATCKLQVLDSTEFLGTRQIPLESDMVMIFGSIT